MTRGVEEVGWQAESEVGVVAAGGAAAVEAGIRILADGGNAADAAAGTILALNVTDHGACSIGGEVPLLIYDARNRQVRSLSGQGAAPRSTTAIDWYMQHGIPDKDIKMAPVPSVVDLCITTLQHFGTKRFAEIVQPTLELLDAGQEAWHPRLAHTLRRMVEEEARTGGSREEALQAACDRFYGRHAARNDIAEELEAFYIQEGGFLRRADLAAHRTLIEEPVSINYRGYDVYKCGPWTQGPYLCQALRLLEGFDVRGLGAYSADYVHIVIEAIKLAMADRDAFYGDPNFVDVPLDALFSEEYNALRRTLIDRERAAEKTRPGDPYAMKALLEGGLHRQPDIGGTTTCTIADRWGNVVAATPSANVYHDGGSGATGVSYGNRLRSLNTTVGHPNCIAPGKRPRITLTPTLVLREGRPVLAVSVAGGDLQDQATLGLLLNHIEFGQLPAEAVVAPRFATVHHQDSFDPNPLREETIGAVGSLSINPTIDGAVRADLVRRGHQLDVKEGAIAQPVMLHVDPQSGLLRAAGDPAAHRHAAGLD